MSLRRCVSGALLYKVRVTVCALRVGIVPF